MKLSAEKEFTLFSNLLDIAGIILVLSVAYFLQFKLAELPCPLCLLQRLGLLATTIGFAMNLRFGFRPSHYGISLLAALFTGATALRQVLLHIAPVPGQPTGYGAPFLGLHLYTWVFVMAIAIILLIAIMLMFDNQLRSREEMTHSKTTMKIIHVILFLLTFLALANVITTYMECGFKQCPDNPVTYEHSVKTPNGMVIQQQAMYQ